MSDQSIHASSSSSGRKEYVKPAITHELKLETHAGSPLGGRPGNGPLDPLGLDPNQPSGMH